MSSSRGQIFSPDLIIAVIVFIAGLSFFFTASNSVFAQTDLLDERKNIDEVAHPLMASLVYLSGDPWNWEALSQSDVNAFGLALEKNVLSAQKVSAFMGALDSNYSLAKEKLGLGPYDFHVRLIDANGGVIASAGGIASDATSKLTYMRLAYYGGRQVTLVGVVSYAR
jgi:hypothetical protein